MKETNRLNLYELCGKYIRTMDVKRELIFLDPHLKCDDCPEKLENYLKKLEKAMLETLQREDVQ